MQRRWIYLLMVVGLSACVPKESVVLKSVKDVEVEALGNSEALLKANANFYNPNAIRVKLKEIKVQVSLDGKNAATVDQKLSSVIKAKSDFSVPLEVRLSLKELGLVDTLLSLIGGKKYSLHYYGYIKIMVRGFPVKVPVDHTEEVRLRF